MSVGILDRGLPVRFCLLYFLYSWVLYWFSYYIVFLNVCVQVLRLGGLFHGRLRLGLWLREAGFGHLLYLELARLALPRLTRGVAGGIGWNLLLANLSLILVLDVFIELDTILGEYCHPIWLLKVLNVCFLNFVCLFNLLRSQDVLWVMGSAPQLVLRHIFFSCFVLWRHLRSLVVEVLLGLPRLVGGWGVLSLLPRPRGKGKDAVVYKDVVDMVHAEIDMVMVMVVCLLLVGMRAHEIFLRLVGASLLCFFGVILWLVSTLRSMGPSMPLGCWLCSLGLARLLLDHRLVVLMLVNLVFNIWIQHSLFRHLRLAFLLSLGWLDRHSLLIWNLPLGLYGAPSLLVDSVVKRVVVSAYHNISGLLAFHKIINFILILQII